MLPIKKQMAPQRSGVNGFGHLNKKRKITIHQTGNPRRGANAQMHANLQSRVYGASWHFQVDEHGAIQSFPYSWSAWHAGDGRGNGNMHSIGIEACINSDGDYNATIRNTAELTGILCKQLKLNPSRDVVRHYDWSRKWCPAQIMNSVNGIDWNKFLNMVLEFYNGETVSKKFANLKSSDANSVDQLAQETIAGKYGVGEARKRALGSKYEAVQSRVNEILLNNNKKEPTKKVIQDVIAGKYGNGEMRKRNLEARGYNYNKVQTAVNKKLSGVNNLDVVARQVINGFFGNGAARKRNLEAKGYNYEAVQRRVNQLLS